MKKPLAVLSTLFISGGLLVGCGANNNAASDNGTPMRNVSYQTNQTTPNAAQNNMGPNAMNPNATNPNMTNPNMTNRNMTNPNMTNIDNYNNGTANKPFTKNNVTLDKQTAQKIANAVDNINGVTYATSLVTGNTVYVGLKTNGNTTVPRQQVVDVVQKYVGNRTVQIVSDQNTVNRMVDLNDQIMSGNAPTRELNSDVRGIFNDLGNAVKRPFQNNAR